MKRIMKLRVIIYLMLFLSVKAFSQEEIKGNVVDNNNIPLSFVNIYWDGTSLGTITDEKGNFEIVQTKESKNLVISSIGYITKKLYVQSAQEVLKINLEEDITNMDEVLVSARMKSEVISKISARKIEKLTTASLEKLPCCHLAASFENTLSVDKTFTDAVTGTEEIKMLGLAGFYSQILSEEVPIARGLSSSLGLSVPGVYLKSISISKGIGSVISGYEGIIGQIQMFLKQPEDSERFYLNLYGSSNGATDINMYKGFEISERWNTMLLVHASSHFLDNDKNKDGFKDSPTGVSGNITQTFKYDNKGKYRHQFGYRLMYQESLSGQMDFDEDRDKGRTNYYGVGIKNKRIEGFSNQMFRLAGLEDVTFGVKMNFVHLENDSYFGLNNYQGNENNYNSTVNIEKKWNKYGQKFNFGASFMYDSYDNTHNSSPIAREEIVPGFHAEYTIQPIEELSIIAGVRNDFHNLYGNMFTPRLNVKYNFTEKSVFRILVGKGYRVANPVNDNIGLMASSRTWNLPSKNDLQEEAWSFGSNISQEFTIGNQTFSLEADYYHTDFSKKLITDLETKGAISFYQLDGRSFVDNYQLALSFDPIKNFQLKIAGRYNNVKESYNGELKDKLFNAKLKGLFTLSYATKYSKWQFDVTNQVIGKSRLSFLKDADYEEYSPIFYMLHAQITRRFKYFDIYLAGENLTNYTQENPIISADSPFSAEFDATRVWAPVQGTKISGGIRFKLK
jgi:hypothetical protein